ncbi:MAG: nucleotidyltransferase family protein [Myxococcota bacterium]
MAGEVRQAVILAAGEGRRMRPVTRYTPKPLLPFLGVPMLDWAAAHLVRAGVRRVAVNAWHLADAVVRHVEDALATRWPDVDWHPSRERDLLGTGGALAHLRGWLEAGPLLVVNADAVFAQDLREVVRAHAGSGADATWVVGRHPGFEHLRVVDTGEDGQVRGILPEARPDAAVFCGIHVAGPGLLDHLPDAPACVIRRGYLPWMAEGADVRAFETRAFWADTGTPERYVDAHAGGLRHVEALRAVGAWAPAPGMAPRRRAAKARSNEDMR